ncbi:MAG: hypothetical protein KDH94_06155, partial [Coxiellaceae bacterium]|nr:hypothetical protein [Coxiellaceae bacterium]
HSFLHVADKLPGIISDMKKSYQEKGLAGMVSEKLSHFKSALSELKSCILPGFFEGTVWTLMDNPIVDIGSRIAGLGGKLLDAVGVTAAVCAAFFAGAVIYSSVKRWRALNKNPKIIADEATRLDVQRQIQQIVFNKRSLEALPIISRNLKCCDPRLNAAVIQYMQAVAMLAIINQTLNGASVNASIQAKESNQDQEQKVMREWIEKPSAGHIAASSGRMPGSIFAKAAYDPKTELAKVDKLSMTVNDYQAGLRARAKIDEVKGRAAAQRTTAFKELQKFGLFTKDAKSRTGTTYTQELQPIVMPATGFV